MYKILGAVSRASLYLHLQPQPKITKEARIAISMLPDRALVNAKIHAKIGLKMPSHFCTLVAHFYGGVITFRSDDTADTALRRNYRYHVINFADHSHTHTQKRAGMRIPRPHIF